MKRSQEAGFCIAAVPLGWLKSPHAIDSLLPHDFHDAYVNWSRHDTAFFDILPKTRDPNCKEPHELFPNDEKEDLGDLGNIWGIRLTGLGMDPTGYFQSLPDAEFDA